MEEVSWYIGARIARDRNGNIHWFIESSDGFSGGHLVDEGSPTTMMAAILEVRREAFAEMIRLHATLPHYLPGLPLASQVREPGGAPIAPGVPPVHSPRGTNGIW